MHLVAWMDSLGFSVLVAQQFDVVFVGGVDEDVIGIRWIQPFELNNVHHVMGQRIQPSQAGILHVVFIGRLKMMKLL